MVHLEAIKGQAAGALFCLTVWSFGEFWLCIRAGWIPVCVRTLSGRRVPRHSLFVG